MLKFQGIFCPLATPFDHREQLYRTKVRHNVARLNLTAVGGYVVAADVGERESLCSSERRDLWREVRQAAAAGKMVLAGVAAGSVKETVELASAAAADGCDAVWISAPRGAGSAKLYYESVADQSSLPVVIAETVGDPAVRAALAKATEHPNVEAICCDAAGEAFETWRQALPQGFPVLASGERGLARSLKGSAQAAAPPLANVLPFLLLSIAEAVRTREHEAAEELERRLSQAVDVIERHGLAALKYAMDLRGMYGGSPRLPLTPLGPAAKAEVEQALDGLAS